MESNGEFRSSYKILTEVFVKYSFVRVKPEGHVGEQTDSIHSC